MKKGKRIVSVISAILAGGTAVYAIRKKYRDGKAAKGAEAQEQPQIHKQGFYEKYVKRPQDFCCALAAIIVLSPVMAVTALLVRLKLGSPVIFKQERPGLNEEIFTLYKFRTMTDEKDEDGNLLPDEQRLTKFGKMLRSTSLDELPELFNILNGDMSVVGPRPQLVRDMVFMTKEQRRRHNVRPGLSGLAQVNGRNNISWDEKMNWDLKYIENISFFEDMRIIIKTIVKAFIQREGITDGDMATAYDYGDWLLKEGKVSKKDYDEKMMYAKDILNSRRKM